MHTAKDGKLQVTYSNIVSKQLGAESDQPYSEILQLTWATGTPSLVSVSPRRPTLFLHDHGPVSQKYLKAKFVRSFVVAIVTSHT